MATSRPHGSDDGESDLRPAKRARSTVACRRCKRRKQRCDNGFPVCGNCKDSGDEQNCTYEVKNGIHPPEYIAHLESKISELEKKLEKVSSPDLQDANRPNPQSHSHLSANAGPNRHVSSPTEDPAESISTTRLLEVGTGFLALSPNEYLGASSGTPLAKIIQSVIQQSVLQGNEDDTLEDSRTSSRNQQEAQDDDIASTKATMPSRTVSEKLIETYLSKVHSKHPFLSRRKLRRLHERRSELRALENIPANQQLRPGSRLDFFMLHMVYAIGARYLQLSRDGISVSSEAHYAAASQDVDMVFEIRGLENLQCMLLLTIYQLRSPSGPGLWSMIGVVMRHCLNGGLHRRSHLPALVDQQRKRLFWTVYMLERSVARTLGRPCCVTDREIDVGLPANVSDEIEDEEELVKALDQASRNPFQITNLSPAIHIIQVQRIESKIHHTIYRVDRPISAIKPHKIARLRAELDHWNNQLWNYIPPASDEDQIPYNTADYHMIQYHKGTLLLLLPFLPSLPPEDPDFRLCLFAAGQVCQLYKRLHDKQQCISYSLLALHATFVAGLVMIYCFTIDKSIFNHHFSGDIRACSTVLYIIAERWPATRKVKTAFEKLVEATVESDCGATSRPYSEFPQPLASSAYHGTPSIVDGSSYPSSNVNTSGKFWDIFGTILDGQNFDPNWTQDGFLNAMNASPEYGWTI